ncbi:Type 2A phosphatase-associated protein 42 [Cryptotrichosporon argae]
MSTSSPSSLPLPQFYSQTLQRLHPLLSDTLSASDPAAASLLSDALPNLYLIGRMLRSLGVFSDNEGVDEVADGELGFMALGWVLGEAESRGGNDGVAERKAAVQCATAAYEGFVELLKSYGVVDSGAQDERVPSDPAERRDAKIKAYRREKELREAISFALPTAPPSDTPIGYLIALVAPSSGSTSSSTSVNPESPDVRALAVRLLVYLHHLSLSALSSLGVEAQLLAEAPDEPSTSSAPPHPAGADGDNTWRLDTVPRAVRPRQLISGGGRVLRPFTIMPSTSGMSERARLQGEVFRESHRLPTMTIDEYLAEEQRRGNIITGGGQASYDAPTTSELLELEAENDGTRAADDAADAKREKDEKWARFADDNRKGEGNTMNRG